MNSRDFLDFLLKLDGFPDSPRFETLIRRYGDLRAYEEAKPFICIACGRKLEKAGCASKEKEVLTGERCPVCIVGRNSKKHGGGPNCFHCDTCSFVQCESYDYSELVMLIWARISAFYLKQTSEEELKNVVL